MLKPIVQEYKEKRCGKVTVEGVCTILGYSRQAYYKQLQSRGKQQEMQTIIELVKQERKLLPRVGTRKLHKLISPELNELNIKCGRDKLFKILKDSKLLIRPKKRYIQTTMSKHWLKKYRNLTKEIEITRPEQLWVSDITYIKTDEGNCYLTLVTDAYSRKIMGFNVSSNMTAEESVNALKMAVKNRLYTDRALIHHSDRGLQFCSSNYVDYAKENNIQMSMTEKYDPYENALAERMNRTIKEEFFLDGVVKYKWQVKQIVKEAVQLYNNYRPHQSLNLMTPEQIHKIPDKGLIRD